MTISVLIPAFNEEALLGQCLTAVRDAGSAFRRDGAACEVVVCDNNSTDRTAEVARAAGAHVVFEPVNQISRARNRAAAAATGDWFVFLDADSIPSAELFADMVEAIRTGRYLGGGATIHFGEYRGSARFLLHVWNGWSRVVRWAAGSFLFCESTAFKAIGGFNEELYVSEEIDLSRRLKRFARARRRKLVILHRHPLRTSPRKFHLYSAREYGEFLVRCLLSPRRMPRQRESCPIWYDGRR